MWLAIQSARAAKSMSVFDHGIGEELPFTMLGWVDDKLVMVCQTTNVFGLDRNLRFHSMRQAAVVLRRAWACTAVTFVAEGYCAINAKSINLTLPLSEQFASGNEAVAECLSFMHVELEDMQIITLPYKYELGRRVTYGKPKKYPQNGDSAYQYPLALQKSLISNEPVDLPEDIETFYASVANGLLDIGIDCQWWDILEE